MHVELIHRWRCPYSAKVRDFIAAEHLDDQIFSRAADEDPGAEQTLMELTGKSQVPCLVVDGTPILESDQIVRWLKENMVHEDARRPRNYSASSVHPR